jgi:hypothetical protein
MVFWFPTKDTASLTTTAFSQCGGGVNDRQLDYLEQPPAFVAHIFP